ncbi:MAG: hypothetical protein ACKOB1_04435, partial [Planctomycetia bacterium]
MHGHVVERHGVGEAVGHDARERPGAGRRDVDVDEPAYQPQRSVEHHDPVAHRAAAELGHAVGPGLHVFLLVAGGEPLHEHLLPGADERAVA